MGVEPYLVSSTVNVVIAQRLVRAICKNCAEKYKPSKEVIKIVERIAPDKKMADVKFWRGKGCKDCDNSGYRGRIGIFEVVANSEKISQLILERSPASQIEQAAKEEGMKLMVEDGLEKV
ncbi:unnamed protein product, partial [marine sediment metagenome]